MHNPRLTVIGTGYLGTTHAVCMAVLGFEVLGVDVDERKVERLASGEVPFFEPGLPELLVKAAPLVLIGTGLSFGFRANVWNIGAEGQYIIGSELIVAGLAHGAHALHDALVPSAVERAWRAHQAGSAPVARARFGITPFASAGVHGALFGVAGWM